MEIVIFWKRIILIVVRNYAYYQMPVFLKLADING